MRGSLVGTAITLAAGTLLTAAMTTATASPVTTAGPKAVSPAPVLVDCQWRRDYRPVDFILACGDGNSRLSGLRWKHWNAEGALAVGVNMVNDCKPYCAAGTFRYYQVTVRLDRPQAWQKDPNVQHFTRMSLTYADARPEGYKQVMTYPLWD
ncbi:hypothetical protein SAMN05428944_1016 [Streptomyces sp. 1222.5]|uniref:hypothetical protein n=1 Tax=unclassified Streptomyces TaxID=2593676 RepID=UPI00089C1BB8|nr:MULTISPECIES: hypothetical protein [unclassified Streptomyces]PKW11760.1 hypothetical protein BX260_7079 [Streptomyces sp. 5112.2]SEB70711.1 hypothetical protein SAMN05428944_1016 [Streptomyces sp. 1222.5]SEE20075.1 hypothetical protein SAMN05216532_7307 [Streptomyces sp. 2231.1]